jgi:hypothetical protein
VTDPRGKVAISKTDKESGADTAAPEKNSVSSWTLNANKAGVYKVTLENLGTVETGAILMMTFNNCKKFQKVVQKTDMDEINARADKAIGTLFHNMVELEHSEARLTHRKESRLD